MTHESERGRQGIEPKHAPGDAPARNTGSARGGGPLDRIPIVVTAMLVVFAVVGVVAIGAQLQGIVDSAGAPPSPSGIATGPVPSASPLPSIGPASARPSVPSAGPTESPPTGGIRIDSIAQVVTNDLLVRSKPAVSDTSKWLAPLLDNGRLVYVVDGPVRGSGYDWYLVQPLATGAESWDGLFPKSADSPFGWVAAAGKDGEAWLVGGRFACPSLPTTYESFTSIPRFVGLACFGSVPMTIRAQVYPVWEMGCPIDRESFIEPSYLDANCPGFYIVASSVSPTSRDSRALVVHQALRSALDALDGRGIEEWSTVDLTGQWDHPDARMCHLVSSSALDPGPIKVSSNKAAAIVVGCRATYVVTSIRAAG